MLRVLLSIVEYVRMRDWFFAATTLAVIAELSVTVLSALNDQELKSGFSIQTSEFKLFLGARRDPFLIHRLRHLAQAIVRGRAHLVEQPDRCAAPDP